MTKKYPIILYPVEENGITNYSVLVPDFPGCVSSGNAEQDALENARAALDLHIQALIESGDTIPEPSTIDQVRDRSEPGAIYGLVEIPLSEIHEKALARKSTRVNITIPGDLLHEIDEYCEHSGIARSRLFQLLAERFLRDSGHVGHFEQLDNVFREVLATSPKMVRDRMADWERFSTRFEEVLRGPLIFPAEVARLRASMAPTKPHSEKWLLFMSYLFDAFWAFEKLRAEEELAKESDRAPAR